jgi:hypothetical protein
VEKRSCWHVFFGLTKIIGVHSHPILPLSRHAAMSIENAAMSDELQRPKGDLTDEKIYLEDEILRAK